MINKQWVFNNYLGIFKNIMNNFPVNLNYVKKKKVALMILDKIYFHKAQIKFIKNFKRNFN